MRYQVLLGGISVCPEYDSKKPKITAIGTGLCAPGSATLRLSLLIRSEDKCYHSTLLNKT